MDRKQMEEKNARLEEMRAQSIEGQEQESVADEYGIEHAAPSEQEKATKAAADKKQLKESFEHAHDGKVMEKGHQEGPQQDSQQVRETGQNPRPIPPPGLDRAGAQNAHQASMVRDDQASKKDDSDLEAFREREHEIGQPEHDRDTMNNEKDHD
jgi:hypothetical protein